MALRACRGAASVRVPELPGHPLGLGSRRGADGAQPSFYKPEK